MLRDTYGRKVDYLRISVTDRCNFRCTYCMPPQGIVHKSHAEMLRYEDIIRIAGVAAEMGMSKVRLTGGEPLVKRTIEFLVEGLASIPAVHELCMTTNGSLLTFDKARTLKRAGLQRVNISLDTLDPDVFTRITRIGCLDNVLRGIDAAQDAGLGPVKINMVVSPKTSRAEIDRMARFCHQRGLLLQRINLFSLRRRVHDGIHACERPAPCESCSRLRLTADGRIRPCLHSDREVLVDLGDIRGSLEDAVRLKPETGTVCETRNMAQIGG